MKLKPDQVGYWGSSFGAIVGSILVSKDPKIKGAVLNVGGGNLPYVISVSGIGLFEETRAEQMRLLGINSIRSYEDYLSRFITTDPLNYASSRDKDRVYMIIAQKDTSVPTKSQFDLYNQFGGPQRALIPAGHVLTLVYTAWVGRRSTEKALEFIVDKLH